MTRPLKLVRTMATKVTNLNDKGIFILKTGSNEDKDKTSSRLNITTLTSISFILMGLGSMTRLDYQQAILRAQSRIR